jgi:hypothetical protein
MCCIDTALQRFKPFACRAPLRTYGRENELREFLYLRNTENKAWNIIDSITQCFHKVLLLWYFCESALPVNV